VTFLQLIDLCVTVFVEVVNMALFTLRRTVSVMVKSAEPMVRVAAAVVVKLAELVDIVGDSVRKISDGQEEAYGCAY
jgi:hypothetical protein